MISIDELINRGSELSSRKDDKQGISDWAFDVERYLKENNLLTSDSREWIAKVKSIGFTFSEGYNLISYLKTLEPTINIPEITEHNKIFIAMWFDYRSNKNRNQ